MVTYAVCEINGKQYKVIPNKEVTVDLQEDKKDLQASVLLLSEDGKLKIGKPYLKEKLDLKNLGDASLAKIRVAKFHAKANFRKVTGSRAKVTKVIWSVKKMTS